MRKDWLSYVKQKYSYREPTIVPVSTILSMIFFEYSKEAVEHKLSSKNFKRLASITRVTPALFSKKGRICLKKTDSSSLEKPGFWLKRDDHIS